jgi:hypothetical protein
MGTTLTTDEELDLPRGPVAGNPAAAPAGEETGAPPADEMFRMISGFWVSRAVFAAARLGIADHLENGPRTAEELAPPTGTHAPSLYRLLRALADAGVFEEDGQQRFRLTPLGETLRTDAPGSLRDFAITMLGMDHYQAWEHLVHSVTTGGVAFEHRFGIPVFEYYARNEENGTLFNRSLAAITEATERAILEAYDFSRFGTIVDVGGGYGRLLGSILSANPTSHGVLHEQPHVIEGACQHLESQGLAGRCRVVAGDFFREVPSGGDAYLLKWILHDWNDTPALWILRHCRQAIRKDGRLLIFESVVPPAGQASPARWMDLNMMVMVGGKERTEQEYRELLGAAGFELLAVHMTASLLHIIEAVPVQY